MCWIAFFKGQPTEWIIKYVGGKIKKEGAGLAFYYLKHNTQIVAIPTSSQDAAFVYNEITNNFQTVTIQGQFTFRINDPIKAGSIMNFTIDPHHRTYLSQDPKHLPQRITNVIQMETRSEIQKRSLEISIGQSEAIAAAVLRRIREATLLEPLGVELMSVYFLNISPTPEVAKALEAEQREMLLKKADQAIFARRAAAVEEERKIKQNELTTKIDLEKKRQELIELEGSNAQQEADFRGKALEKEAEYKAKAAELEFSVYRQQEPKIILALALKELGHNAAKIGNLTITSEIISTLLNEKESTQT